MRQRGLQTHRNSEGRATCYTCFRPHTHCMCKEITPFTAHTNFLVLQHPNEWRKYYSTAKLVKQTITNSNLLRGVTFEESLLHATMNSYSPYLLYPGATSVDCEEIELSEKNLIIVLDGTWDEAQKIVYRNSMLHSIPRISFRRPLTSSYRIRKPPKGGYLSTVESVGHLLTLNAVRAGKSHMIPTYQGLFRSFNLMVERQLAHLGHLAHFRV